LPKLASIQSRLKEIFRTGQITNGKYVHELEEKSASFLGVENAVAVSSGTSGLMLAIRCLELKGEVIIPSFTFTSGGHALLWCGLTPVFADINPRTFNIDPDSIESKITERTSAIIATHVFSNPCDIEKIQEIAEKHNLKVIYDAAHAFGSKYKGKPVAHFGDISVFSMTPTKVLTSGEGGLIAARGKKLAEILRLGRNNGDSFNRDEEFLGITARMGEFNAILALEGLKRFNKNLEKRLRAVEVYKKELAGVPGLSFQETPDSNFSVYKDFTVLSDDRDALLQKLNSKGVEAKAYFYPLHKKIVYREYAKGDLPNTDWVASRIMSLPLYSHMLKTDIIKVCEIIKRK